MCPLDSSRDSLLRVKESTSHRVTKAKCFSSNKSHGCGQGSVQNDAITLQQSRSQAAHGRLYELSALFIKTQTYKHPFLYPSFPPSTHISKTVPSDPKSVDHAHFGHQALQARELGLLAKRSSCFFLYTSHKRISQTPNFWKKKNLSPVLSHSCGNRSSFSRHTL